MPLAPEIRDEIQTAYRAFLDSKSLKPRGGQKQMIAAIANFLADIPMDETGQRTGGTAVQVVEAGTGTGKTLAYALAAIPMAKALDKKLVIATATVALQEQVLYRDLPDMAKHAGLDMNYVLAKGRRRYLCLSRLDYWLQGAEQQTAGLYPDEIDAQPAKQTLALYQSMADAMAGGEWAGDRDDWDDAIDDADWFPVTADQSQCSGRRCNFFKQCSVFKARDALGWADVIVANHDLVLADLGLGGGAILPPPEDCIYVFDEAHHLPDKALGHFSHRFRLAASLRWLEQTQRATTVILAQADFPEVLEGPVRTLQVLLNSTSELLSAAKPLIEAELDGVDVLDSEVKRYANGIVPPEIAGTAADLARAYGALLAQADQCESRLQKAIDDGETLAEGSVREQWLVFFSNLTLRCQAATELWQLWAADAAAQSPPLARWLALTEAAGGSDVDVCCSPVLACDSLQQSLWDRAFAVVLTSATLSALGDFARFDMRSGLSPAKARYLSVPSPFRFAEVAELVVPAMDCDPRDVAGHTRAVTRMLPGLLDGAGNLVLFSSRRQMQEVYDGLDSQTREQVLVQGRYSKQEVLRRHREAVDAGERSVLFGLASFAEGVDLPGDYCRHVIIAKIPFSVPNDPVEEALSEWIERNNGKPFMEISVPDAALRLIQASGRLLRNEQDEGRISILDRRLVSSFYGRRILDSLPPYRRVLAP